MGFVSFTIIYIFCQSIISIVSTEQVCLHEGTNTTEYFSTKTPYKIRENKNSTPYDIVPDECVPLQIWMMFRHGTRYPSTKDIVAMNNRLPQLKDQIIGNQNNGTLCGSEIEKLEEWRVHFEPNDDQRLAVQGEIEMIELAKRFMDRFPTILDQRYSNESYKMRFTDRQRTQASARSFALGLFGPEVGSRVWFADALPKDPILRFYKLCKKWLSEIDDTPAALQERLNFEASESFQQVLRDVAQRLGVSEISSADLILMYRTCSFETAMMQISGEESPWCAVFSENDLQVIEYAEDLRYYWRDGYGFNISRQQACPAVQDLLRHFQRTEEDSPLKATFYFTHSGVILKLLAYLGLYHDEIPLLHSNFEQHRNRQWRVGVIDSFASNIGAVLHRCGHEGDYRVLMLHQERVVTLPGCPENQMCPLSVFRDKFSRCDFDEVCQNNAN